MKKYIENFKQYLINLSKSNNTIRNYTTDVSKFFEEFDELTRENIIKYKSMLCDLSAKTINCKLTSLKSFNEYLIGIGVMDSIVIIKQDFTKIQNLGNPTNITDKEVKKFLNRVSTKKSLYKSRNIALINLIASTGIRREETTNIKLKDIDLENHRLVICKGKGNKLRIITIHKKAIEFINDYLNDRATMKYADSPYLFISERSEKLHKNSINDIFDFYCTPKCKITPHQLRHHVATTIIEQGVLTLPELQNQLGHSSLNVTSRYTHAREENIRKKIDKLQIW